MPAYQPAGSQSAIVNISNLKNREIIQIEQIETALQKEQDLDYMGAIEILSSLIDNGPTLTLLPKVYYFRGKLYDKIHFDERAINDYREVLKASPPLYIFKDTLFRLGEIEYRLGNYSNAFDYYHELMTYFSDSQQEESILFKMGYLAMTEQNAPMANAFMDSVSIRSPAVADFALYYKGKTYYEAEQYAKAIKVYQNIIENFPNSPLKTEVMINLALSYEKIKNYTSALDILNKLKNNPRIKVDSKRVSYHIALCQEYSKDKVLAIKGFRILIKRYPNSEYALLSLSHLNKLLGGKLENDDYFFAGHVRFNHREYKKAVINFKNYINKVKKADTLPNAHFMLAKSHLKLGEYQKAINEFSIYLVKFKNQSNYVEALYLTGTCYSYLNKYEQAIKQYDLIIKNHLRSDLADEAFIDKARAQESLKRYDAAKETYAQLWQKFPYRETSQWAQFQSGLDSFLDGDYTESMTFFNTIREAEPENSEIAEGSLYWAHEAEKLRYAEGQTDPGSIEMSAKFPNSYYLSFQNGVFSPKERILRSDDFSKSRLIQYSDLENLKQIITEKFSSVDWESAKKNLEKNNQYIKGKTLCNLGLRTDSVKELMKVETALANNPDQLWLLLTFYIENEFYQRSIYCARQIQSLLYKTPDETPACLNRFIYPIYFPELIFENAAEMNVDPMLLCAVIRQESMFEGNAASWANAHGLMQIIPATGRYIAKNFGIDDFSMEMLYIPENSIKFGSWYLADLYNKNEKRYVRALAGYNGGPMNIKRWLDLTFVGRDDVFAEKVTYKETRQYLKKVLGNYQYYQNLWGNFFEKNI